MRNVDKFTFTARSKDLVQQIRIQNCKGHNLVETAGLELLVAFCERVMGGVGRGGFGQPGESGPGSAAPQCSALLRCTHAIMIVIYIVALQNCTLLCFAKF